MPLQNEMVFGSISLSVNFKPRNKQRKFLLFILQLQLNILENRFQLNKDKTLTAQNL